MELEEATAARIKADMGASKTATAVEAAEEVAAADMVEVALIEVAVEVAAEVSVEAWAVVSEVVASINLVDHGTKDRATILVASRIILTTTPFLFRGLVKT